MYRIDVWKMKLIAYKKKSTAFIIFWGTNHIETIGVENYVSSKPHGVISSPIKTKTQNII